jgi:hypothetical protein
MHRQRCVGLVNAVPSNAFISPSYLNPGIQIRGGPSLPSNNIHVEDDARGAEYMLFFASFLTRFISVCTLDSVMPGIIILRQSLMNSVDGWTPSVLPPVLPICLSQLEPVVQLAPPTSSKAPTSPSNRVLGVDRALFSCRDSRSQSQSSVPFDPKVRPRH